MPNENATKNSNDNQQIILDLANEYLAAGIWAIPIAAAIPGDSLSGKTPKAKNWPTQKLTFEQFKALHRPGDNIGVVCGKASGLICIDVDPRNGGMRWFIEHEHELGSYLKEDTGGGGLHLFYQYPAGEEYIKSSKIADGVEIKADGGAQVVVAPSVHYTGGIYNSGNVSLLDLADFDEFPRWLVLLLKAQKEPFSGRQENGARIEPVAPADHADDIERAIEHLKVYPGAVQGNSGDQRTFQAACLCRDYGLKEKTAYKILLDFYNPRCSPPWAPKELKTKVANAYKYAKGDAGEKGIEGIKKEFSDGVTAETKEQKAKKEEVKELEKEIDEAAEKNGTKDKYNLKSARKCADTWLKDWSDTIQFIGDQGFLYNGTKWVFADKAVIERGIERIILSENKKKKASNYNLREIYTHIRRDKSDSNLTFDNENSWLTAGGHRDYIALENGILDLRTLKMFNHHQDWFSFNCLPFEYQPGGGKSEVWNQFLDSIWSGQYAPLKALLQLWVGYLILGHTNQQKFALFMGASRAGKGTIVRTLCRLMGKGNWEPSTLTALSSDFGLQPLLGKKLIIFPDIQAMGANTNLSVATERILSIVGEDAISINRKNMTMTSARLPGRIILTCNEMPPLLNHRRALTNRMLVFPFEKNFAGREDHELEGKLENELPGIFNWALEGVRRILAGEKLENTPLGSQAIEDIAMDSDSVLSFERQRIQIVPIQNGAFENMQEKITSRQAYEAYAQFCADTGRLKKSEPVFFKIFARSMTEKGRPKKDIKIGDRTTKCFVGVKILDENSDFSENEIEDVNF